MYNFIYNYIIWISFHPAPVPIEPVDYKINFGNPIRTTEYTDKNGNDVVENLYYSPGPVPAAPANYEVEFGDPIRILEYVDEYGNEVTEKIYFCPIAGTSGSISFLDADDSIDVSGSGGAGWYQNEKKLDNSRDQPTYIYVKAYFTWKDGDVSVSNASGWVEGLASGVKVISESVTTGTDSALFTGKYAYAKYSLTTQNLMTIKQNDSVAVKVRYRNIS